MDQQRRIDLEDWRELWQHAGPLKIYLELRIRASQNSLNQLLQSPSLDSAFMQASEAGKKMAFEQVLRELEYQQKCYLREITNGEQPIG